MVKNDPTLDPQFKLHKKNRGLIVKQIAGYLFALGCLFWVFYNIHIEKLFQQIANIKLGWIFAAIFFDTLSYFSQGLRWHYLLRPIGSISPVKTTQAIYAGLFTNEIIPFRAGELVRAYLISFWEKTTFFSIIPSMVIERFFDGIWLGIGLGVTAIFINLPENLMKAADILGIIILIATGLFIYLIFRREKKPMSELNRRKNIWKPIQTIIDYLSKFTNGIKEIGITANFYYSLFSSSLILISQILAFWMVLVAYHIDLSIWQGAVVLLIVHFGTALPNAPSNIGSYQFFCVLGLSIFGIGKTTAAGFSVVVFIILTIPHWLIGFFAITKTGMTLREIRHRIRKLRSQSS
jgi:uncharacterized protein (TIRG00374 family)